MRCGALCARPPHPRVSAVLAGEKMARQEMSLLERAALRAVLLLGAALVVTDGVPEDADEFCECVPSWQLAAVGPQTPKELCFCDK